MMSHIYDWKAYRRIRAQLTRFWLLLQEPRSVTVMMMLIYISCIVLGAISLQEPQFPWDESLNALTRIMVNWLLITGGFLGVCSVPRGVWGIERGAIMVILGGFVTHLIWTLFDPMPGVRWGQALRITIIGLFLVKRWLTIRASDLDPTVGLFKRTRE